MADLQPGTPRGARSVSFRSDTNIHTLVWMYVIDLDDRLWVRELTPTNNQPWLLLIDVTSTPQDTANP